MTLAGRDFTVQTAAGVFSPGHIDLGTTVLLKTVPAPQGHVLDLGCGWGPIALTAAILNPDAQVTAVDVNERALDLLRRNAKTIAAQVPLASIAASTPDQVPGNTRFDVIWSNPPIRIGKDALHQLLADWLPRLRPGGVAYLVVQKNLGADSLAKWIGVQGWGHVEKIGSSKGFRVLQLTKNSKD